jgi:hypothetical protein
MIGEILFLILISIGYIIISMHTFTIIDDGKAYKLVWVVEKLDSDKNPYTKIKSIVLWTYNK